jgi:hypothetical protein
MKTFKFDASKTLNAFVSVKGELNYLNRLAHSYVLEGEFFSKHSNALTKSILDCVKGHDVIEKNTLAGKLAVRLSYVPVKEEWSLNKREEYRTYVAGVVCSVLVDGGDYPLDVSYARSKSKNGKAYSIPVYQIRIGDTPTPKDLINGYSLLPQQLYTTRYGRKKLNGTMKNFLKEVSSIPFRVSSSASKELFLKGYSLMTDYHSESSSEAGASKRERIRGYADVIMDELATLEEFYLPVWLDSRGRMYYEAQLLGIRPQGKLWETLMIDSAEPVYMDDRAIQHIQHIIYVNRYGRSTLDKAVSCFTQDDLDWAANQDPLDPSLVYVKGSDKEIDEFGMRILMNKCAEAIAHYEAGFPCYFMFGKDLTNSGLIMAAASFKSSQMMPMANLVDIDKTYDSHTETAHRLAISGIERKEVKKFTQGLFHGSSIKSLAKVVNSLNPNLDMTEDDLYRANHKAFGDCIDNIDAIATWGSYTINNECDMLSWTTPDGLHAHHIAKATGVPITVWSAAAYHKDSLVKYTVTRDMPLAFDNSGNSVYSSTGTVEVKNRGLYANITHSLDGFLLRKVIRRLLDSNHAFLMKHDDYMVAPAAFDMVIDEAKKFLNSATLSNFYQSAVSDVARNVNHEVSHVPTIVLGDSQIVIESENFLMP